MMYNIKMNFIKVNLAKNWSRIVLITYAFIAPAVSLAADTISGTPSDQSGKLINPIAQNSFTGLIHDLLVGAIKIGLPIVALAIIYCGFLFVFARGNTEKLGKAKEALLYTLIGAAILLGSWAIAQIINSTVTSLSS